MQTIDVRRWSRWPQLLALVTIISVGSTACVGSVDRDEFERIIEERGGGLSQDLVIEAVERIGDETDGPVLARSLTATNETVTVEAVSPDFPDELDRYTYRGGDLNGPDPVDQGAGQVTIPDITVPGISIPDLPEGFEIPPEIQDLIDQGGGSVTVQPGENPPGGATVFSVDDVALDRLDEMVDSAIEAAGLRGGFAANLTISVIDGSRPTIRVNVTNDRRSVTASFGPGGRLLDAA